MHAHGLLLAAGAGRRMGRPKALVEGWLRHGVTVLRDGGCERVTVVLGAGAEQARPLLDGLDVGVVVADDWAEGMGASLRAGLRTLATGRGDAAVVLLVDLPDVTADVVRAVLARVTGPDVLARATYGGTPGHPVVLGRAHWSAAAERAVGDAGARGYLAELGPGRVVAVECGHLATGVDVDRPG